MASHDFEPARYASGRFHNVSGADAHGLSGALRWLRTRQPARWPQKVPGTPAAKPVDRIDDGTIRTTVIGHATILIQTAGLNILTDPVWSDRAGPLGLLGPRRVCPPAIALADLPRIDLILLSHNHYDHLDRATLRSLARRDNPAVFTGLKVGRSVPSRHVFEFDWWQMREFGGRLRVTYVPAEHFSGRGPFDRNASLWGGFVVESPAGKICFAGDTGTGSHFAAIRDRFGPMDLTLMPIGAYAPRWFMGAVHVDPGEAVAATLALGSRVTLGIHYGTFHLADEAYEAPVLALAEALAIERAAGREVDFRIVPFGTPVVIRS